MVAAGVVGLALLALRFAELPIGACTDDAFYVAMARSLAAGHGPVIGLHPQAPAFRPDVFPSGFPMLLAPVVLLLPASLEILKAVPLLAALLLTLVVWRLPAPNADRRARFLLVALVLWNPWTIAYATRILSDLPYAAVSLGALLAYRRWTAGGRLLGAGLARVVVLAGLAVMIRTIGLALCVALIGHLLLQRRYTRAAVLGAFLCGLLAMLAVADHGGSGGLLLAGYRQQVLLHQPDLAGRLGFMADNFMGYLEALPATLMPLFGNPTAAMADRAGLGVVYSHGMLAVGAALASLVGLGMIRSTRSSSVGHGAFALYLLVYFFGLLNFSGYPAPVQLRLLVPVLPLLYLFLGDGADWLASRAVRRQGPDPASHHFVRVMSVLAIVIMPMSLVHNVYRVLHPLHSAVEESGLGAVDPSVGSAWIRAHTRPGEVVMTQNPIERHIHWYRPVVDLGEQAVSHDLSSLCARIEKFAVRYVVIAPHVHYQPRQLNAAAAGLLHLLRGEQGIFELLWADPDENVYIFGVRARCELPDR